MAKKSSIVFIKYFFLKKKNETKMLFITAGNYRREMSSPRPQMHIGEPLNLQLVWPIIVSKFYYQLFTSLLPLWPLLIIIICI